VISIQSADTQLRDVARFRAALRAFQRRTDRVAQRCGLTPQRYELLLAIRVPGQGDTHATISTLRRDLDLPQTTITDLVARAVKAGLVMREQSERDGRVWHLRLTKEGERRLVATVRALEHERAELRASLQAATRLLRTGSVSSGAHGAL
jgi:DNA-binding MarR family transcriptional regulator